MAWQAGYICNLAHSPPYLGAASNRSPGLYMRPISRKLVIVYYEFQQCGILLVRKMSLQWLAPKTRHLTSSPPPSEPWKQLFPRVARRRLPSPLLLRAIPRDALRHLTSFANQYFSKKRLRDPIVHLLDSTSRGNWWVVFPHMHPISSTLPGGPCHLSPSSRSSLLTWSNCY